MNINHDLGGNLRSAHVEIYRTYMNKECAKKGILPATICR